MWWKNNKFGAGNLADTSFDETCAAGNNNEQQFDSRVAEEVIKYRDKVASVLES